jgi:hypothetical protein
MATFNEIKGRMTDEYWAEFFCGLGVFPAVFSDESEKKTKKTKRVNCIDAQSAADLRAMRIEEYRTMAENDIPLEKHPAWVEQASKPSEPLAYKNGGLSDTPRITPPNIGVLSGVSDHQ